MARPRSFDETHALRQAVQVFWTRGYPAAGVRELCDAMGIRSGSLYASFQSKPALFVRALDRYVADLQLPKPSPAAARAWLTRVAEERSPTGCLLALAAAEHHALPPEAQDAVQHHIRALDRWLIACLSDRPDAQARADGALLSTVGWGLQVQHRAGVPASQLQPLAADILFRIGIQFGE